MPRLKTTWIYQLNRYSFTESWFRNSQSPDPKIEIQAAKIYAESRQTISGGNTSCIAIRVSNVDDKRQKAYLEYVSYPGVQTRKSDGSYLRGSTAPAISLNMEFQNPGNTQEKLIQLRGVWDDVENDGGQFAFNDPVFVPLIQSYGAKIRELQYGWLYSQFKRTAAIIAVTQDPASGVLAFTFGAAAGGGGVATMFTAGEVADGANIQVRLSETIQSPNLNGQITLRVTGVSSATSVKPVAITRNVTFGKAARYVKDVTLVNDGRVQRIGKRQAGAPLLLSRGRGAVRTRG